MKYLPTLLRRLLPALALTAVAVAAQAAYPEQPIRMIVAYAPGGGTDLTARLIAPYIARYLGNNASIVVVNRSGAGGGIGFAELANAPADGYTIGFINTPNVLTIPIERKSNFHWTGYDLLGNVIDDPGNFSVHNDTPIRNLGELVAYAKANPGKVTYGTTGIGSDDHLAAMLFERAAGVQLTHVPFKGASEVHQGVVGKQIFMASMNVGEAMQYEKGGSPMHNLGQMSAARTNLAPGLPTFKEQGFDIVMASLRGIAAPKGLPAAVKEQLASAVQKAANDPEFQAKAAAAFAPLRYLPPAKYEAELKTTEASFKQLWKEMPWGENGAK
ncbi:tripartite tricarboxylate transporter substrate binding protein [Ramlibacter ginsenosidimutans]|uniref:Tripartite tricarboxylate transporter substrate binding protein n=1 Tax=Ramlibacter ginsenosidimutans TaxID=502333 RepID=A0A934WL22_9BURK|nr:tripartite tricarboxylate transporter substrate binding protein [Ramlibacter ginsenosidimutans]MBK6006319.1 tripartite tricarboxylate transporter substrate binding protein [Ramlibacter ginsenosidimutans]